MVDIKDCKVALIDKNGAIYKMGEANELGSHALHFIDYLDKYYPDIDVSKLNIGSPRDRFGYILGQLGNIIYFNDLDTCMIYFPNELTDAQVETMYNIDLGNQRPVVFYDLQDLGNFIVSATIGFDDNMSLKELMDMYLQSKKNKVR